MGRLRMARIAASQPSATRLAHSRLTRVPMPNSQVSVSTAGTQASSTLSITRWVRWLPVAWGEVIRGKAMGAPVLTKTFTCLASGGAGTLADRLTGGRPALFMLLRPGLHPGYAACQV